MNIDDYRAMVAQEKAQQNSPQVEGEQSNAQTQQSTIEPDVPTSPETQQSEPTQPTATPETTAQTPPISTEPTLPQTITIEGIGDIPLEEVTKGYLRQSDYTKKTQELANQRKQVESAVEFYKQLQANPELSQQLSEQYNIPDLDPAQQRVAQLEQQYHDLLLEREVERMQAKYEDFDVREVLQVAYDKKLENLEDAYLLVRSQKAPITQTPQSPQINIDEVKAQLRQELLQELELERNTRTIIQSGGDTPPTTQATPQLTEAQLKVARSMRLSPEDYVKWAQR